MVAAAMSPIDFVLIAVESWEFYAFTGPIKSFIFSNLKGHGQSFKIPLFNKPACTKHAIFSQIL